MKAVILLVLVSLLVLVGCTSAKSSAPSAAADGYEAGNGGVLLRCKTRSGATKLELLDFYRAKLLFPGKYIVDFGFEPHGVMDRLRYAFSRLQRLDSWRAQWYQKQAETFFQRVRYTHDTWLPDTRDYGDLPEDPECATSKVEQLVIQRRPLVEDGIQFLINRDLWKELTDDQKAGVVLHEIIYQDAIQRGHHRSLETQTLTALLSSERILRYSQLEYNHLMVTLNLATVHEQAPVWDRVPLDLGRTFCAGVPFSVDISFFASHPAKDLLSFEPVNLPAWLSLDSDGLLHGKPPPRDARDLTPIIRATNGRAYADVEVRFRIADCNSSDPFFYYAYEGGLFHASLPSSFHSYVKLSGPKWLDCNPRTGDLSGTPQRGDAGDYAFQFEGRVDEVTPPVILIGVLRVLPRPPALEAR